MVNGIKYGQEAIDFYYALSKEKQNQFKETYKSADLAFISYVVLRSKLITTDLSNLEKWMDKALYWSHFDHKRGGNLLMYAEVRNYISTYYNYKNEIDSALYYCDLVLDTLRQNDFHIDLFTNIVASKTNALLQADRYDEAIELYYELYNKGKEVKHKGTILFSIVAIGACHAALHQDEEAIRWYRKVVHLQHWEDSVQQQNAATLISSCAKYYEYTNNTDSAIYFLEKSLSYIKASGRKHTLFNAYISLAKKYLIKQDSLKSNENFEAALALNAPLIQGKKTLSNLENLLKYLEEAKKYPTIITYAQDMYSLATQLDVPKERAFAIESIVQAYIGLDKIDSVAKYLALKDTLNEQYYQMTQDSAIIEAQTKFKTAEKERQIVLLNEQNRLISQNRNLFIGLFGLAILLLALAAWFFLKERKLSRELKVLNHTQNKLFSVLGHDLRNPFNVLMSISKRMGTKTALGGDPTIPSAFDTIYNSSQKTYYLFNDLLDWGKSQTGKLQKEAQHLNLNEVINESKSVTDSLRKEKNIRLNLELDYNGVFADKSMLQTVFRNLLTNAFKFTPEGGSVTVSSKLNDNQIHIEIKDNGIGMSNAQKDESFSNNNKGLGLLLCKEFVEANQGTIGIKSQSKKGTTVWIKLPKGNVIVTKKKGTDSKMVNTEIVLSPKALELLTPYMDQLEALSVYYTSELKKITKILHTHQEESLSKWTKALELAIENSNEEVFKQLINNAKK
jgi:signal transduction histidine kinase